MTMSLSSWDTLDDKRYVFGLVWQDFRSLLYQYQILNVTLTSSVQTLNGIKNNIFILQFQQTEFENDLNKIVLEPLFKAEIICFNATKLDDCPKSLCHV
jgi:hypothetical protein